MYVDHHGVPGAGQALDALARAGIKMVFVTNNSTKTRRDVLDHIALRTGYRGPADVITSGMATARQLAGQVDRVLVVGGTGLSATLVEHGVQVVTDWRQAEAVAVGLDREVSYEKLAVATLALRNGAAFYATNTDATYPMPDGLYPGAGAFSAFLERSSGREPVVCGKPHEPVRAMVREVAGDGGVLAIGDRPETDIAMGKAEGWATVLVLTGVVADPTTIPAELEPDVVLPSIADLPAALNIG